MSTLSALGIITERTLNFNDADDMNDEDELQFIEDVKVENLATVEDDQGSAKQVNLLVTQN